MPRLRFTCELPTVVRLGRDSWRIALVQDGKSRPAIEAEERKAREQLVEDLLREAFPPGRTVESQVPPQHVTSDFRPYTGKGLAVAEPQHESQL
jgi:hypothetical protein